MASGKAEAKSIYKHFVPAVKAVDDWFKNFNFVLIESMEDLEMVFADYKPGTYYMSFDTETTGLNFEELDLVGYSFCLDGRTCYYVPVYHFNYEHNLGEPAVEFIYRKMVEAKVVPMFNARYDMRVMEFRGYKEKKDELKGKRWKFVKYDMSKVNYFDLAVPCWNADTNKKMPSLKWSSSWFLGFSQMHFDEVIDQAGNFFYLNPSENPNVSFYAGADALCTYLLVPATMKYYKEGGVATKVDNKVLYPLMHYEEEKLWLDGEKVERMYNEAVEEVDKLEREVFDAIGYQINLNSPIQVAQAFNRLGIETGEKTETGNMATGIRILEGLPEDIQNKYPALRSFIRYKETFKLLSSYFSVLKKEYESRGFLRCGYKTTDVPTGRLAAGKDGKNTYFSPINVQALPKPHVSMYDVFDLGDRNLFSKKDNILLGYQFVLSKFDENKKHIIPDDERYIGQAEGMNPKLNVRDCITGKMYEDSNEDEWVYLAADYAAQELRITANMSREPVWLNAFLEGRDVHKSCYSLDTEFLTKNNGFQTYDKIDFDTEIAQYDEDLKKVTWVKAGHKYFNKTNTMYHFRGEYHDLMVTPNHRMYDYKESGGMVIRADALYKKKMYNTLCCPDIKVDEEDIDSVTIGDNLLLTTGDLCKLVGYVLSDFRLLEVVKIINIQLYNYIVKKFNAVDVESVYLPNWFKNLKKEYLSSFLLGYAKNKDLIFSTYNIFVMSKQLADDIQFIFLRLGFIAYVKSADKGYEICAEYKDKGKRYVVCRNISTEVLVHDEEVESVCFAVPTGLLVVRRNGKVSVCGNTAVALWGEENYNKDLRKRAKGVNFGVIYGMGAPSLIDPHYGISTLEEAEEFYNKYKNALPTLFQWIDRVQRRARRNGSVNTFFGRPRRVKGYYDAKKVGFANRTAINTMIQGCHVYDNLVLTDVGYQKIGELYDYYTKLESEGQSHKFPYKVWNGFRWCKFVPVERGKDIKYKLHFDNNQIIECDSRHRVKVFTGEGIVWKPVKELELGKDCVAFSKNSNELCSKVKIKSVTGKGSSHSKYKTPIVFSGEDVKDLCYMYGASLGDGHIKGGDGKGNRYILYFGTNAKKQVDLERIKRFLTRKNINYSVRFSEVESRSGKNSELGVLTVNCISLVDALLKLSGDGTGNVYTKRIGKNIFRFDRELVREVLKGIYDTDGIALSAGLEVANEGLARDYQLLLDYYGYESFLSKKLSDDCTHYFYSVTPRCYEHNVVKDLKESNYIYNGNYKKPILDYHKRWLKSLDLDLSSVKGMKLLDKAEMKAYKRIYEDSEIGVDFDMFRSIVNKLNQVDNSIYFPEDYDYHVIMNVENTGEEVDTYTLCVDDSLHQYVCEGMISKNTAGDMLKIVMCRLWGRLLNNPEYENDVAFRVTIHDEIQYACRASRCNEILGIIEDTQAMKLDQWPVKIETEGSIGWSMGSLFAWERVKDETSPCGYWYKPKLE